MLLLLEALFFTLLKTFLPLLLMPKTLNGAETQMIHFGVYLAHVTILTSYYMPTTATD